MTKLEVLKEFEIEKFEGEVGKDVKELIDFLAGLSIDLLEAKSNSEKIAVLISQAASIGKVIEGYENILVSLQKENVSDTVSYIAHVASQFLKKK